ncbi:Carboxypeptidase Y [Grifola frondosa]|uniref:carboxypeptidase C n=1 Tax=Grifola frondosa TaxID=5627 RepID=A0A1C7MP29_GRIFR|nr:Carboxypeptidase Y [Grifola frondosa]
MPALIRTLCLLSLLAVTAGRSQQHSILLESAPGTYQANASFVVNGVIPQQPDAHLFTPLEDLKLLSDSEFTSLSHPSFPRHGVRIKRSNWCDGTVQAYTGYIDIEARHLFFYFFESRSDPDKDDVIFWTNGGPGGSSSMGLLMELGPCKVTGPNQTEYNPYSWNEQANIFFIDQPVSVGYSYAEYGESVGTTQEAAKDVAAFVAIFFENFAKFKGRPFHMAGQSYGGRYIPLFASTIYDQNARLIEAGMSTVNLTSIMIGNGCTDVIGMMPAYYDMQCKNITVAPVQRIDSCVRMRQALPRCEKRLKESCSDQFDLIDCQAANAFCKAEIVDPFIATGYNPFDVSRLCEGEMMDTFCYSITKMINAYLNRADVRSMLGVDPAIGNYSTYSPEVGQAFAASLDKFSFPAQYYIAGLLERGVRALIYAGANDWICNWVGNERMTLELEWTGQQTFRAQPLRAWNVDGKTAGLTRSTGGFTFATIYGAGHMVPYDMPAESLELVKRWLAAEDL